jgi:hypothetical protein
MVLGRGSIQAGTGESVALTQKDLVLTPVADK